MTPTTITLPDGGSATFTLRDPSSVTERQRRPVTRAQLRLAGSAVGRVLDSAPGELADDADDATKAAHAAAAAAYEAAMMAAVADPNEFDILELVNDSLAAALLDTVIVTPAGVEGAIVEPVTLVSGGTTVDGVIDLPGPIYDAVRTEAAKHFRGLMPAFSANPDPASPTPPSAS